MNATSEVELHTSLNRTSSVMASVKSTSASNTNHLYDALQIPQKEDLISSNAMLSNVLSTDLYETTTKSATTEVTLRPALPYTAQLSLTVVYIVMFSLLFVLVYVQLWMIWYYRHKRLSHQTLFLFMGLIWAGLRTSLFSFYFYNCEEANNLNIPFYWLMYSFPVCLQFAMLCLLLHFFAQVVLKAKAKYEPSQYQCPLRIFLGLSVLLFTSMNLACAIFTKLHEIKESSVPMYLYYIRVTLTETMFLAYGILLSMCIFKMTKMVSSQRVLEAKGTTVRKAVAVTILINLLFLSRTVYNLISICNTMKTTPNFGYDWINVTDQADSVPNLSQTFAYASFGLVLFVWEVLPIFIVVIFFRVKRLTSGQVLTDFSTQSHGSRVFFFDNPRRYDSEDDLSSQPSTNPHGDITGSRSLNGDSYRSLTPRGTPGGTPINAPVWGYYSASPTYPSASSPLSGVSSSTILIHSPRRLGYGSIQPAVITPLRPPTTYKTSK
uniref:Uncharacterized protein n=1 Tax=Biomphalaria glabrata TaxID=6526 RepID=A0A2C9KNM9_BIOGL